MTRELNEAGETLIKGFEGIADGDPSTVNLDPYMDLVGYWTIAWGHLITYGGRNLRGEADRMQAKALYPDGITMDQAEALFKADVLEACRDVEHDVLTPLTDNEFAALVSFTFNEGGRNLDTSTMLRMLNLGDIEGAAQEFPKWNRAGGAVVAGLTRRRLAEQALFETADAA